MVREFSSPSSSTSKSILYFVVALCLLSFSRLIWIGDIPYGNDDSQLFLRALSDSNQNLFTTHGLMGSRGMNYGPFAIWTYRAGLSLTRDLILFAGIRIFITTLMVSLAVYLLSVLSPFLVPPIGLLALLSPYLWLYGRDLWDNSYVIPLSGIAITAYLYFCKRESASALFLSLLMCTFGVLTHLVFIPVVAGIGLHLTLFKKDWLKKHWIAGASSILICFVISLPYLLHLMSEKKSFSSGGVSPNLGHLLMPLLGARFFSSLGIEHFTGKSWYQLFQESPLLNGLWVSLLSLSALIYPITWYGLFQAGKEAFRGIFFNSRIEEKSDAFDLCFLSVSIFLIEVGLSFYLRLIPIPNFYSPFWLIFLFFAWYGFSQLWHYRFVRMVFGLVSVSLIIGLSVLVWTLHSNSGNRWNHYGPTLSNLVSIAQEIENTSSHATVSSETFHLSQFPLMMESLREIIRPDSKPSGDTPVAFEIEYQEPNNLQSGRLVLRSQKQ